MQIVVPDKVVANFAYYCSRSVWFGGRGGESSQVGLGGQGGEKVRLVRVVWSAWMLSIQKIYGLQFYMV